MSEAQRAAKSASWLRVKVVENGKKKFSLRLPLGILSVAAAGLNPFVKWAMRHAAAKNEKMKGLQIDKLDIRQALKILKDYGPMTVIEVEDKKTYVLIRTE